MDPLINLMEIILKEVPFIHLVFKKHETYIPTKAPFTLNVHLDRAIFIRHSESPNISLRLYEISSSDRLEIIKRIPQKCYLHLIEPCTEWAL